MFYSLSFVSVTNILIPFEYTTTATANTNNNNDI